MPGNLSVVLIPSAIPACYFKKGGIIHQTVLFMGQILPESEKKTPKNQCHHPSAISRYKQYWLQHKLEIRKGKGGFEEHIETQTTHREFIDLPEQWAWEGKELLHLREA